MERLDGGLPACPDRQLATLQKEGLCKKTRGVYRQQHLGMNTRFLAILLIWGLVGSGSPVDAAQKVTFAGAAPSQRVDAGSRVALRGSGWSTAGRVVRFAWTQVDGPPVRLRDSNRSTASFVSPKVTRTTVLKFQLTVTDIRGNRDSSVMTVTVEPRRTPKATDSPAS